MPFLPLLRAAGRRLPPPIRRLLRRALAQSRRPPLPPAAAPIPTYAEQHAAELAERRARGPAQPMSCRFALLTTLYAGSRAAYFREAAASVAAQNHADFEWIILEKGQIEPELAAALDASAADPRIRRLRSGDLPIVAGMRLCLEAARTEYVVPLDYDDVLTEDALAIFADTIARTGRPGLVYSDEDMLSANGIFQPYRRPGFDPVLNAVDSYIWHLCAFRRDRALALDVYTESRAEFCHDWDTVTRFEQAGERIEHVPEVLYHWRTHPASSSNSGDVNQGSLASVRFMLERTVARQAEPGRYRVDWWPLERGFPQYTILRRPLGDPGIVLWRPGTAPPQQGRVFVVAPGLADPPDDAIWEAVRLFEMHPDLGAAGGRVLDASDIVRDACVPARAASGGPGSPWLGRHRNDGGDFAHGLKPQTVAALPRLAFVCRADLLPPAAAAMQTAAIADHLAQACRSAGLRLAYSPLIELRAI